MVVMDGGMSAGPAPLLASTEPETFEVLRPGRRLPVLLVCDHASRLIPDSLGGLGLSSPALESHIAWDIGAAALTRALSALLQVPAVLSGYSRLVVDCNRHLEDASAFPAESDGIPGPGNERLAAGARPA